MIQMQLSSLAQIIAFLEEGPDRHLPHLGQLQPLSFIPSLGTVGWGCSISLRLLRCLEAQNKDKKWEVHGRNFTRLGGKQLGFEPWPVNDG